MSWVANFCLHIFVSSRTLSAVSFSEDIAVCARTRDSVHKQALQLPDYQLQMDDWDRYTLSYCTDRLSMWFSHAVAHL